MADRLKGITIEIGGDTTGLSKSLSGINKEIRNTQSELRDVERLLKLDPTNTELLQQRHKLLAKAVDATNTRLEALKDTEKRLQEQFARGEITQEQYDALTREIVATRESLEQLKESAKQSNTALALVGATAGQVSEGAEKVASATRGLSAAAGGALAAIGAMAYNAATASDDLNTLANQTGFSTEELQKMEYAAGRIDVELDSITGAAAKMTKNLTSTSAQVTDAWDRLGVAIYDSNGELRDSTEIFYDTIAALSLVANETERDTLAMTIFGRSANELAGIVDDGGAALRALGDEAENLGLILDQETLDGLNAVNDEIDKLKAQSAATIAKVGAKALQALTPVIEDAVDALGEMLEFVADLDEDQIKFAISAIAVVAAISPMASIIAGISTAIKGVSAALALLNANPIMLAITAVVGLGTAIASLVKDADVSAEAAENLFETIDEGAKQLEENITSIDATEQAAGSLIDRLDELNRDGLDPDEVDTYNATLAALIETVPELTDLIDEQTGEIKGGTDALRRNTAAWAQNARQQAYNERLTALYKEQANAMVELAKNETELEAATTRYNNAAARKAEIELEMAYIYDHSSAEYMDLQNELDAVSKEYYASAAAMEEYGQKVVEGEAAVAAATDAIEAEEAAIAGLTESETELIGAQDGVTASTTASTEAVDALAVAYAEAYDSALASINSQIGLFDTFTPAVDETLTSMGAFTDSLNQQAANLTAYADNLNKAAIYGLDEGLIASLADGSVESAGYIGTIITDLEAAGATTEGLSETSQAAVDEINAAYAETEQAREYVAATIAGIDTQLSTAVQDGIDFGTDLINGMVTGINAQSSTLYSTITTVVDNAIAAAEAAADVHSPSKKTMRIFEDVGEGMIVGVENTEADVAAAVRGVVDQALALDPRNLFTQASALTPPGSLYGGESAIHNNNYSRTVNVTMQNTFGGYDGAAGAAATNDLVRQINRALGRVY